MKRFALILLSAALGQTAWGAKDLPTFNKDIAPVVFANCVECHHPGGAAPFSLTTFREVKKRAQLIARVTARRIMPPWPPEPGHAQFQHERGLTDAQIATIAAWVKGGAPEGSKQDLPELPAFSGDWQLGPPDLVLTVPEGYTLPAAGSDVYRNFVIPDVVPWDRYLRACEFRPGSNGAVHHAFVLVDDTGAARRRASREAEPGFPGMDAAGAVAPDAMFMSWQPGGRAAQAPPGLAVTLRKTSDLVLQLHLRPTGKPEKIKPSVGLYFTPRPPARSAVMVLMRAPDIDIPAGANDYAVESSYRLPVDADVLSVLPHMHYLGKEAHGWAELPDGTRCKLIRIKQWDFDWQGDYRYVTPVSLPKGSTLRMRYTYDNSAANPSNPHQPPKRVTIGLQSSDEMGEFWVQLLPKDAADLETLRRDYVQTRGIPDDIAWAKAMLRKDPRDAARRTDLGAALAAAGQPAAAVQELEKAIADDPNQARSHYLLGQMYRQQNNAGKAAAALERAAELDPEDFAIRNNLGWLLIAAGNARGAITHLEKAVQLNPSDPRARQNLERARAMQASP